LIAIGAVIDESDLELGRLSDEDWARISAVISTLSSLDIRFIGGVERTQHDVRATLWPLGQKPQLLIIEDADAKEVSLTASSLLTWIGDLARERACIVVACTALPEVAAMSRASLRLGAQDVEVYHAGSEQTTSVRWVEGTSRYESSEGTPAAGSGEIPG
jgi:hypothetical protein